MFGFGLGTVLALLGIAIAHRIWVVKPGTASACASACTGVYRAARHAWYFNELIDALVVRPAAAAGQFAKGTFERTFVDETLIGGTTGIVRAGSAAVRAMQSGFVRYYAALLILGVAGVGFYFLLQS